MDTIERLRAFVRVVESGSFSATAKELGLGQPAVSRAIGALEQHLGARLLHRSTRRLSLTDEGERVYEQSLTVLEHVDALEGVAKPPPGVRRRVRVACPLAFGTLRFIRLVATFNREHPDIEIELRLSDAVVDLVEDGIDVAIRFGALADASFVARAVGRLPRIVVASRAYLARRPAPKKPADLVAHDCVVRGRAAADASWPFDSGAVRVSGPLKVDNFLALREAVLAGAGLGLAGTVTFLEGSRLHPELVRVLSRHTLAPLPVHVVFQRDRHLPARVRTFIDFVLAALPREPWIER